MSHFKTWEQAERACADVEIYSLDKANYTTSGVIAPEVVSTAPALFKSIELGGYKVVGTRGSPLILRDRAGGAWEVDLP